MAERMNYIQTTYDSEKKEDVTVAEWIIASYPECGILQIQRESRCGFSKKLVRVEDSKEFTFKLMKTKIKAAGGVSGLFRFIDESIDDNFMVSYVNEILEYAFFEMREAKLKY